MRDPHSTFHSVDHSASDEFEELLVSHQARIYFFIRSMVFNREDAQDILQDVNGIILLKRHQFALQTNFKAWAFSIARFECLTYLRRLKAGQLLILEDVAEHLAEQAEERADGIDFWIAALDQCRKHLNEESGKLIEHRYILRTPLEEVAKSWKTTEGALKQKLFRIREQLRACILKRLA
ncbi:MAG: sigma-70 family RNA polymerase sigma factor [Luteolibacter sp.]